MGKIFELLIMDQNSLAHNIIIRYFQSGLDITVVCQIWLWVGSLVQSIN